MKCIFSALLVLLAVVCLGFDPVVAQSGDTMYVAVDYMQVPRGGGADYVQMEQELWKPIHEERIRRGLINGWSLYGVMYSAPDAPYNYVTVNAFDDMANMEGWYANEIVRAAHPGGDLDEMGNRTLETREIVHSEVWQLLDTAQPEEAPVPFGQYIVVDYKQVPTGGGADYVAMEREDWKPVHQELIDRQKMSGWALYILRLPGGATMKYNYGTVNFFSSLANVSNFWSGALIDEVQRAAHPNATEDDIATIYERAGGLQTNYKRELWQLVDSVNGMEE